MYRNRFQRETRKKNRASYAYNHVQPKLNLWPLMPTTNNEISCIYYQVMKQDVKRPETYQVQGSFISLVSSSSCLSSVFLPGSFSCLFSYGVPSHPDAPATLCSRISPKYLTQAKYLASLEGGVTIHLLSWPRSGP